MKKINLGVFIITLVFTSCGNKRHPGKIYMPDMAYSRAYETYEPRNFKGEGFNYVSYPVKGTIRRGDLFPYTVPNDSNGFKMSAATKDPLPPLDTLGMNEAQRLYNINCGICHGTKLDAQGPLAVSGKVGGIVNLKLAPYKDYAPGTIFHVATYGKGNMGSYASQLDKKQRWMVVQYVKSQQAPAGGLTAQSDSSLRVTAPADTTAKL